MIREYTSRRQAIVNALVEELKNINGVSPFITDLAGAVFPGLRFWDEVENFPSVYVYAGNEYREYQGGGYKDRYLSISIMCYVNEEDPNLALEGLLEDVEAVVESASRLVYKDRQGVDQTTQQISITSIFTDQGVLAPLGVGEIEIVVRY